MDPYSQEMEDAGYGEEMDEGDMYGEEMQE
jgi:hypothetical protein